MLKALITSVRSDILRKEAALKLYAFAKEMPPEPYNHTIALRRFIPHFIEATTPELSHKGEVQPVLIENKPKNQAPSKKVVVEEGDSLWKISRRHHVTVEDLRQANRLDSDRLRPGQVLFIP
jgi:hypothetical protein